MKEYELVICIKCKEIHMQVNKAFVQTWLSNWQEYWLTLDDEGKEAFGVQKAPPGPEIYLKCSRCNNSYKNMSICLNENDADGHTLSGIMDRNEEWD